MRQASQYFWFAGKQEQNATIPQRLYRIHMTQTEWNTRNKIPTPNRLSRDSPEIQLNLDHYLSFRELTLRHDQ